MRVLITGGFGYLGGRVAQHLSSLGGYEVILGSRTVHEPPDWLPQASVRQTLWDSPSNLDDACAGVDAVIHASGMNAQDCAIDPVVALEANGVNTGRLLQAAIRQGVKRFIYISTAHVYGSPLEGTITEETCPLSLHPYATSHRAGEDLVRYAHQRGQIEGIVVRLSNAFGAPTNKEVNCWMLLINDLCRQAVTTQRMTLRSSGLQRRDFITLHEVAKVTAHLIQLPSIKLKNNIFNIGGGWSPTVLEVACIVQERCLMVLGFMPELSSVQPRNGEVSSELYYQIDALLQSGYKQNSNRTSEIDKLIEFCMASHS